MREKYIELAKAYGLSIEEVPQERSKSGLALEEYKARQEEERARQAQKALDEGQHPLVVAAKWHGYYEYLHPFRDGNGRTGRLLSNFILLRANHPLIIIRLEDRAAPAHDTARRSELFTEFLEVLVLVDRCQYGCLGMSLFKAGNVFFCFRKLKRRISIDMKYLRIAESPHDEV